MILRPDDGVMSSRDSLLAALVATIWGFNFVVIDWGMDGVPPLVLVAVRFAVVMLPALFLVPSPNAPWRTVAAVGAFMSLGQFAFLYVAMDAGLPPGLAALVLQAQVIFTIVIAAGVLRERPTRAQVWGVVVGSAGLVVVGFGRGGDVPAMALGLCVLGALSWGIGNVISRSAGVVGGLSLVSGRPWWCRSRCCCSPWSSTARRRWPTAFAAFGWQAALSTLYTAGLASLVGYAIFNSLLARNESAYVVPWVLLAPVVAMASAYLLLDQVPSAGESAGGLLLVIGVLVAMRSRRAPAVVDRRPAVLAQSSQ